MQVFNRWRARWRSWDSDCLNRMEAMQSYNDVSMHWWANRPISPPVPKISRNSPPFPSLFSRPFSWIFFFSFQLFSGSFVNFSVERERVCVDFLWDYSLSLEEANASIAALNQEKETMIKVSFFLCFLSLYSISLNLSPSLYALSIYYKLHLIHLSVLCCVTFYIRKGRSCRRPLPIVLPISTSSISR